MARKGLRVTLLTGAILIILGAWARILVQITGMFQLVTIGTVFVAFGQAFFYISSTKISSVWFGDKERTLSTVLGALSLSVGSIFGFVLPSLFVNENNT